MEDAAIFPVDYQRSNRGRTNVDPNEQRHDRYLR